MKNYIPFVLILLVLVGSLAWLFIYTGASTVIRTPDYTIGSIVSFKQAQRSAGLDAIVEFNVKGKRYKIRTSSTKYQANVKQEKFKVQYEKNNPTQNILLKHEPIFIREEKTKIIEATVTRLYQFNWFTGKEDPYQGIEFEFKLADKVVKKEQVLPPQYKSLFPKLRIGNKYVVEYWIENPKRSIIHLNKPLK